MTTNQTDKDHVAAAVAELVANVREVSPADARRAVGGYCFERLSPRQRAGLALRIWAVRVYRTVCRVTPRGGREALAGELLTILAPRFGRRVSVRTLQRWRRTMRRYGTAALADTRGRPRGPQPLDGALLVEFGRDLAHGVSLAAAHERMRRRATRTGRRWPRSLDTIKRVLQAGAVAEPPHKDEPGDAGEYLTGGLSAN